MLADLYNDDCFNVLPKLKVGGGIDYTFTSPPYNRKRNDKYQNYILDCIDAHGVEYPPKPHYYVTGVRRGRIESWSCGNCGFDLSEPQWDYCPNCGRKLPMQSPWEWGKLYGKKAKNEGKFREHDDPGKDRDEKRNKRKI